MERPERERETCNFLFWISKDSVVAYLHLQPIFPVFHAVLNFSFINYRVYPTPTPIKTIKITSNQKSGISENY